MSRGHDQARRRLREANPIAPEQAASPTSPEGEALFQQIVRRPEAEKRRPFWRRRRGLLVLVPAMALGIGAGYALTRHASDPLNVACFREPSLSSNQAVMPLNANDLLLACRPLWEPGGDFNPQGSAPPPLAACILDSGGLAVFPQLPNTDTCMALGLDHATGEEIGPEQRAIQAVQEELSVHFIGACLTQGEATSLVEQSLRRHGLVEWRVKVSVPFTDNLPCASLAFDFPDRTIKLVPVSRERSS
jgi:hypothetical protein